MAEEEDQPPSPREEARRNESDPDEPLCDRWALPKGSVLLQDAHLRRQQVRPSGPAFLRGKVGNPSTSGMFASHIMSSRCDHYH